MLRTTPRAMHAPVRARAPAAATTHQRHSTPQQTPAAASHVHYQRATSTATTAGKQGGAH
jgi:hypothetical protein